MNASQLILIILFFGLISCREENNEITIIGKIAGDIPETIEYTVPVNSISYFGFEDAIQPDSLGNFQVKIPVEKACFVELSTGYQAYGTLIAEPGMSYKVFINSEPEKNIFKVECESEKGQSLYNQISNRSMIAGGHFELEARKYIKDSIVTEIKQSIKKNKEIEMNGFRKLFEGKVISKDFYDLVSTDREYFYNGVQGSVAFINYLQSSRGQNALTKDEFKEIWNEVFLTKPVSDPKLMKSFWFFYYTQNYLRLNELILESINPDTLKELRKQNLIHSHNIQKAKQYLSDPQLEYYYSAYLFYEAINKNYEKELISLFGQFKEEYPSSEYIHFLEPEIIPIISFHKKQSEPLNRNIKFINDSNNINSLQEIAKELRGERIYVDVWATWCGYCKKEFSHSSELYDLLKSKNVTILYLSIDSEDREKQWRDMINYYDLEGYHIRANEKLVNDLRELRGEDSFGIPWYILTDGNGNIIEKYVDGPSQIEKLEQQLSTN